jgi:hypothetical protein
MDHPIDLASAALSVLAPYLAKVRKYDAAKFGDGNPELGGKLLMWLRENLDSRGHEAIIELAAKPDSASNSSRRSKRIPPSSRN